MDSENLKIWAETMWEEDLTEVEKYLGSHAVGRQPENEHKRLFVDMDGTLAVFTPVDKLETLYQPGYFYDLRSNINVVQGIREFIKKNPDVEVYILSSVLSDSQYALSEKNQWLDQYLPEIPESRRLFPPCGVSKKEIIPGGITDQDWLLDDFTQNLLQWDPPGIGIKLLNGINHTKRTWKSNCIHYENSPELIADSIRKALDGNLIKDKRSGHQVVKRIKKVM